MSAVHGELWPVGEASVSYDPLRVVPWTPYTGARPDVVKTVKNLHSRTTLKNELTRPF